MVRIQVNQYYIQLLAESSDPTFLDLITKVRGIEKMRSRGTYRCSLRKLPEILKILRNIDSVDQLPAGIVHDLYEEETQRRGCTRLLKELGPDMTSDWLWPHQCLGIELAQVNRRYNFFYDTRTGKTLMMLRVLYDRLKSGQARRCLVICPSAIIKSWLGDAKQFPELRIAAFYGDIGQREQALKTPAHIILWATEQVASNIDLLKAVKFDTCVFDESSKLKNHKSKIAEAARDLSTTIPSWYNLSATPAPNGHHEYYTQMMCVDPYSFSSTRGHFVEKYFDNTSRSDKFEKLVIKTNMFNEFMSIVNEYSVYVDQDVMPTAGKEWHVVSYKMQPETYKTYANMCSDMAAEVEGITITAEMAAAMRSKLNQITSGFLMDTEAKKENVVSRKLHEEQSRQEVFLLDDTSRLDILRNLISNFGSAKCVIWANFTEEFRELEELFGTTARYVRGGTSIAEKEQYIYKDFKAGPIQYLVCHPLSVGMGINLTEAHIAIYYSLNDSWEALKQSSERIYGHISVQPNKCHYYVLQAEATVNEVIYDNLKNKRDISTGFLNHLKACAHEQI